LVRVKVVGNRECAVSKKDEEYDVEGMPNSFNYLVELQLKNFE
jgi:hypothetical protein